MIFFTFLLLYFTLRNQEAGFLRRSWALMVKAKRTMKITPRYRLNISDSRILRTGARRSPRVSSSRTTLFTFAPLRYPLDPLGDVYPTSNRDMGSPIAPPFAKQTHILHLGKPLAASLEITQRSFTVLRVKGGGFSSFSSPSLQRGPRCCGERDGETPEAKDASYNGIGPFSKQRLVRGLWRVRMTR